MHAKLNICLKCREPVEVHVITHHHMGKNPTLFSLLNRKRRSGASYFFPHPTSKCSESNVECLTERNDKELVFCGVLRRSRLICSVRGHAIGLGIRHFGIEIINLEAIKEFENVVCFMEIIIY